MYRTLNRNLPMKRLVVSGLLALSFGFAACVIVEEVPYEGGTEFISSEAAGAETVLIANIEEGPGTTEVASRVAVPETTATYALPRSGADTIRPYLTGKSPLPVRASGVSPSQLNRIYAQNGYNPIWFTQDGWLPAAQVLIRQFQGSKIDGLVPNDYLPADRGLPGRNARRHPEFHRLIWS